jgi:hypothetical protein
MPEKRIVERARRKAREGKSPSTQAGEFVREEIHHVREGKHGARSPQQAVAIGLSKARRAGVKLGPPPGGKKVSRKRTRPSARLGRAVVRALRREPHRTASRRALSRQSHRAASRRSAASRRRTARKAARTRRGAG